MRTVLDVTNFEQGLTSSMHVERVYNLRANALALMHGLSSVCFLQPIRWLDGNSFQRFVVFRRARFGRRGVRGVHIEFRRSERPD